MKNTGITLISLVVTIIILIILAGISISMILGNEGLLNKAKYATESYSNAQQQEEIDIAKLTNQINSIIDGDRDTVTISKDEYDILKNSNDYTSANEIIIGKWIDGKYIYRKIIQDLSVSTGTTNFKWIEVADLTDLHIDKIVNAEFYRDMGYVYIPSEYGVTNNIFEFMTSSNINRTIGKCIIEYTKSEPNTSE